MHKICIVGGGTAGWFTAAFLAKQFITQDIKICLIESSNIPSIGVGESVTPHVVDFIVNKLEISEKEWMQKTGAIFKLANRFVDWKYPQHSEYFSFAYAYPETLALNGQNPKSIEDFIPNGSALTTDLFLEQYKKGSFDKFDKYFNPQFHWMDQQKFHIGNLSLPYGISHHINADLTSEFVKEKVALPLGVEHITATVEEIVVDNNKIKEIYLDNGQKINADFYVDCSGFKRLLISKLTTDTKDYNYPIDRAVVGRTEYINPDKEMANYTQSIAQDWGWIFRVTLANRIGNGFCYSSSYITDEFAEDHFASKFNKVPRLIKWKPERLTEPCKGNVVCVGLSNGFIEPLEANNLYVIIKSVNLAYEFINGAIYDQNEIHEHVNNKIGFALDDIHDFLLVHYTLCNNNRSKFWNEMYEKGKNDHHEDLVYSKFKDPKNNMIAAFKGETLFPDYMWLQFACSWGLDVSKWISTPSKYTSKQAKQYFNKIYNKNLNLSTSSDNFYQGYNSWLKQS